MKLKHTLLATAIATASMGAQADLARQGPVSAANGFPAFYQDNTGLALDLCLPNTQELIDGSCLLFPANIPSPTLPIAFPGNFPDELFYWNAGTVVPLGGPDPAIGNATLVLGLEAAFATGPVTVGGQIVFSRIRYRFIAPVAGSYTVDTPFSSDTFDATAGELIFNTVDIGINCPQGDFSCAMKGKTAPFLRASLVAGGAALPPVVLPGGNTFLTDPNIPTTVTGGANGNSFKITGPNGIIVDTDQFNLMGRVHTGPLPSFTTVDRVTYARNATSSQVDVFATSITGLNSPASVLQLLAPDIPGAILKQDISLPTKYHAQVKPIGTALPANVFVTNTTDVPVTVLTGELTDMVSVSAASFDSAAQTLTVTATSSDEVDVPTLTATGSNNVVYGTFTAGITLLAQGVTTPPNNVVVSSSAGGRTTINVTTDAVAAVATVVATNDTPAFPELSAINVLANDQFLNASPVTVRIVRQPEHGSIVVGANNVVAYSARGSYSGPDSFTYYIDNAANGLSNIASVDFTVQVQNRPPVANPDTAGVTIGSSVTVDAKLNDTDPDNDAFTITALTAPASGTATIVNDKVVYTPAANTPTNAPQTIGYTITDANGATASSTITVTIQAAETVTVPKASYLTKNRTWQFEGTDNPLPTGTEIVTVRFYAGAAPAAGTPSDEAKFIGQATVTAGRFKFGPAVSTVLPIGNTFHVRTSRGKVQNFAHTVG